MGKKRIKPFISGEGSAHYRLVHRSQRDPLQADEEASKMVLQVVPKYLKSANSLQHSQAGRVWQGGEEEGARYFDPVTGMEKTYEEDESPDYDGVDRDDGEYSDDEDEEGWEDEEGGAVDGEGWETDEEELEQPADSTSSKGKAKPTEIEEDKIGQAPLYGIFLDDREYDYTKHLKPIGESTDAVFVPAKTAAPAPVKRTGGQLEFKEEKKAVRFEMPEGVLPSAYEEEVGLLNRGAENKSLLLEVEPHVREVLYALDDDAYVDAELDDDFFAQLDSNAPPGSGSEEEYESEEDEGEWGHVAKFKREQVEGSDEGSEYSEERDDGLSKLSMTSSALFRNKHMTLLDDRFDKMLQDEYEDEEEFSDEDEERERKPVREIEGMIPQETTTDQILTSFLDSLVLQGSTLVPSDNPMEEIDALRSSLRATLREGDKALIADGPTREYVSDSDEEEDRKWDVETVLTTYSNIYNHPALLDARKRARAGEKIELDANGIPVSWKEKRREEERKKRGAKLGHAVAPAAEAQVEERVNKGTARVKGETKEEKKARKEKVKEERRTARVEKKELRAAYEKERGKMERSARSREMEKGKIHIA